MDINELLLFTHKNKASDLHLTTGQPPVLRINGDLVPYKTEPLNGETILHMLHSIMSEAQRAEYQSELEVDFAISVEGSLRFRVNAFHTVGGPAVALRIIPSRIRTLDELAAPDVLKKLCLLPKGLILLTGPTGSGKSTTLAAMIEHINSHEARHIITIEDPVEFIHSSKQSLINQREVGRSTKSFSQALKSTLREDPNVIMIGELRDIESIQLALTAAETGHLVMATLHTRSAPETIDRIIDVFPASDKEMVRTMLASSLEAVVTQLLLKRADNSGRVAAHEIMLATPAIRNLIREGKAPQLYSLMQIGAKSGMRTMKDSVHGLHSQGLISEATMSSILASGAGEDDSASGKRDAISRAKPAQSGF